jgi:hypothetical protein
MTNRVRNTSNLDPLELLVETGFGAGIEAQEARGQRELVSSEVLPSDCDSTSREALEAAGVVFGDQVEDDPIFQHVTLPEGWKKRPTDHSMWSELVDAEGNVRASIFYKAAFYDRSAHMSVRPC